MSLVHVETLTHHGYSIKAAFTDKVFIRTVFDTSCLDPLRRALAIRSYLKFLLQPLLNRPLYLLLSGFARGQALGCHAVARADHIQKSMQKHCRDHGKRPVCRSESSASSFNFSPSHWSWRCHLLARHWAEIDRLASGAERAREIKEKKQLAIADAGAALLLPSRKARQVREELAESGKQIEEHKKREEEMERLLASSNVRMPA